jgi:hypothetical protein
MLRPWRSSAIVRIDVATMVWSSAARNMPSINPERMVRICRCESAALGSRSRRGPGTAALVMRSCSQMLASSK